LNITADLVRLILKSASTVADSANVAGPVTTSDPRPLVAVAKVSDDPTVITVPVLTVPVVSTLHTPTAADVSAVGLVMLMLAAAIAVVADAFAGAADRTPAPNVATATSAMRLRSVFVDMFFLSLVEIGHFPISARRSFDLLIPFLL
jgi:hypothetical protein